MNSGESTNSAIRKIFSGITDLKKQPWSSLWKERIIQYLFIFDIVAILGSLTIWFFHLAPTHSDNSLYFTSAMVQAQAAIVSLVITLTLIAIQMAAASYTPRVVDVMKKNPDLWLLLIIYVGAISYGFFILKIVGDSDRFLVSSVFLLGIFSFLTLFLYMKNTIALLRPDEIVKMLVDEINDENIHEKEWTDDIMQPVFVVVHASINRFDVTTTRIGINSLSERLLKIFQGFDNSSKKDITKHFCDHIRRSALVALQNDDEGILEEIITVLEKHGIARCKYNDSNIVRPVIKTIEFISLRCVERNLSGATIHSSQALEQICQHAFRNELDDATLRITYALYRIGVSAADNGMEEPSEKIVLALKPIGIQSAEKLLQMGKDQSDKAYSYSSTLFRVISLCGGVGQHAADKKLDRAVMQISAIYREWGNTPAIYMNYILIDRMAMDLGTIGRKATSVGLDIAWSVAGVLGLIGERASHLEMEDVLKRCTESLRDMGIQTITSGRMQGPIFDSVIRALYGIGCTDFGKNEAARHIAELSTYNKIRIAQLINEYRSKLTPNKIPKFESLLEAVDQY
ncbi:MAG: DUF2254 family protein [Methanobacterium sp.]